MNTTAPLAQPAADDPDYFPAPALAAGAGPWPHRPVIAIHGGAGTIRRDSLSAQAAQSYHAALHTILSEALAELESGASAVQAVALAVQRLEDCPLFNAGHGSVFTSAATHELDAAIMDGSTLHAGAVAAVSHIRHPVRAAQAIMQAGRHVLMVGAGAEAAARAGGLQMVAPEHFSTPERLAQLHAAQASAQGQGHMLLDHDAANAIARPHSQASAAPIDEGSKMGTVGAVALDIHGNLAAATSTGGMTNKHPGRVGDSPLIGSGTYADNRSAAVSCTGHGEAFIRSAAAHDLCARMAYGGHSLQSAAHAVIHHALPALNMAPPAPSSVPGNAPAAQHTAPTPGHSSGGSGGLIAVDAAGNVCMTFNTEGMYRGIARAGQGVRTFIHRDEHPSAQCPA